MQPTAVILVLSAALMHATWNALLKSGKDKVAMQVLIVLAPALPSAAALPFFPTPAVAAWPLLALSATLHGVYYFLLLRSYEHGDLSQIYPIVRGSSPLLIAAGGAVLASEELTLMKWLALGLISVGIGSLALMRRAGMALDIRPIGLAVATGLSIALYSLADGIGVRRAGSAASYILWLLTLEAVPMLLIYGWMQRSRGVASLRPQLLRGAAGGAVRGLAYGIVIWAMQSAPMAEVSALRETSVVFAASIGALFLGEPFGRRRILAAALVAMGSILLHLID